jgi:hypothetical protein
MQVPVTNVFCRYTDIFNREFFALIDIIKFINNGCNTVYGLFIQASSFIYVIQFL